MNRLISSMVLVIALAACSPPSAPPSEATAGPQPSAELSAAFPDCAWGEVRAAGVSLWSFACPQQRIVGDESLPGFVREDEAKRYPVIRLFSKAAGDPVEAALPAIRAASAGAETCVLEPISGADEGRYQLMPTGEARRAYEAFTHGQGDGPSMPCGPLGPSEGGMRVIQVVDGAPDKVAVIDTGSDIQLFDIRTLRASP